jgi:hypothetical protein
MRLKHKFGLAAILAACSIQAQAATISYDFVIDWIDGDLAGRSSAGSVSLDAALAQPGASYKRPDLLTDFQFSLRGQNFSLKDVTTGYLSFDGAGKLFALGVGTDCQPGICYVHGGQPASFAISYYATNAPDTFFASNGNPAFGTLNGKGAFSVASSVPEPATAVLVGISLCGVGLAARRRALPVRQAVNES